MMETVRDPAALRAMVGAWKRAGQRVGVAPTMGALHAGHLALVRAAKAGADRVIVTLFVNPTQFNNAADLAKYPRTEDSDAALLAPLGVDVLFAPEAATVYPPGFATRVSVGALSDVMDGAFRPGHFDGVATVVAKLLLMTGADRAFFGEKDWQQLQIVRRLAADLNLPVEIVGCPTVRETDGLALSSRNARLSAKARGAAPALHRALTAAAGAIRSGAPAGAALEAATQAIRAAGFAEVEYIDLRDSATLQVLDAPAAGARVFAAAWLDGVRLIDNIPLIPTG